MSKSSALVSQIAIDGIVFELPLTGIARATLGLYEGCLEIEPELQVELLHRKPLRTEIIPQIQPIRWGSLVPGRLWRRINVPLYVRRHLPQVLHSPWNGGVPDNLPDNCLKVLTLHDILPLLIPDYLTETGQIAAYRRAVQQNLLRADVVITDSKFSQQSIIQNFETRTTPTVIYPAASLSPSEPHYDQPFPAKEKYFLYCGGYDKRKGINLLVSSFNELWKNHMFRVPLWLVGTPNHYSRELTAALHEGKSLGAIRELNYVSDQELTKLYQNALALLYPSRYEGFGLPPLEAMSLGCPVVTYPLTSLPEVCGDAALYIDPDRDDSLKDLILNLANDEELRQKLSKSGLRQAATFSWHESAKCFLDVINERYAQL